MTDRIECDWCDSTFESSFRPLLAFRAGTHVLFNHPREVREWDAEQSDGAADSGGETER